MREQLYIDLDDTQKACLDYTQAVYMLHDIKQRFKAVQDELADGYKEGAFTQKIVKDEERFGYFWINLKLSDFTELLSVSQFAMAKTLEEMGKADDYVKRIALDKIFDNLVETGNFSEANVSDLLNERGVNGTYDWFNELSEKGETMNFDYTEMSEQRNVSQGSHQYEQTVSQYASQSQPTQRREPQYGENKYMKPQETEKTSNPTPTQGINVGESVTYEEVVDTSGMSTEQASTIGLSAAAAAATAGVLNGLSGSTPSSSSKKKESTSETEPNKDEEQMLNEEEGTHYEQN